MAPGYQTINLKSPLMCDFSESNDSLNHFKFYTFTVFSYFQSDFFSVIAGFVYCYEHQQCLDLQQNILIPLLGRH